MLTRGQCGAQRGVSRADYKNIDWGIAHRFLPISFTVDHFEMRPNVRFGTLSSYIATATLSYNFSNGGEGGFLSLVCYMDRARRVVCQKYSIFWATTRRLDP